MSCVSMMMMLRERVGDYGLWSVVRIGRSGVWRRVRPIELSSELELRNRERAIEGQRATLKLLIWKVGDESLGR